MITIEWLAALVTRQRDALVQQQVQKLQIQQTIQTLQQTQYLSNPAIFRDYSNLVDQMNVQIAQEAQKVIIYHWYIDVRWIYIWLFYFQLEVYQTLLAQQVTRQLQSAAGSSAMAATSTSSTSATPASTTASMFGSNLFNSELFAPQLASQSNSAFQNPNMGGNSRQLRIDQCFQAAPNRSTLSGTSQSTNLTQPKEEPGQLPWPFYQTHWSKIYSESSNIFKISRLRFRGFLSSKNYQKTIIFRGKNF